MTTLTMVAPAAQAGLNVTTPNGNTYTSNANGFFTGVALNDLVYLQEAGCSLQGTRPVVTLNASTASSLGTIVLGAINVIPSTAASSVSYAYTLPPDTLAGRKTTITQPVPSTATSTVTMSTTSSLSYIGSSYTTLTWSSAGSIDLEAISSLQFNVAAINVRPSSAGGPPVNQPASS